MIKVIGTGLNGLVGSRITELLSDRYEFENLSYITGVDITSKDQVLQKIAASDAQYILHLAAKTNVDVCEKDSIKGRAGEAWKVNVEGTKNVAEVAAITGKKIIYISTGFVFDGKKDFYTEDDIPLKAVNWYGQTKLEAEAVIRKLETAWVIARIEFPYRASFEKLDFMRAIKNRLEQGMPVKAIDDQVFTPTFIDDIASAIDCLILNKTNGVYHVVGNSNLSPYQAALQIAQTFSLDQALIGRIKAKEYFNGKANRPFRLVLKNDKIAELGVIMKSFDEGLEDIKNQLS